MYFKKFPTTIWNKTKVVDITRRAVLLEKFADSPYAFLPYTMKEEDSIESVALYYYGDPKLSWLILVANNIIDPYTDMWKNQSTFEKYVAQQYRYDAEVSEGRYDTNTYVPMTEREIVEWTMNETITDNVVHYYSTFNKEIHISKLTYSEFPNNEFLPLRIYDYENEVNESRRNIKLIAQNYVKQVTQELENILND
jgi:hypothetical protein